MKLLIVEDHAGMRSLIRELVREIVTEVRECTNAEDALALCATYAPDVVTLDLRLGAMSGLTAAKQILGLHPLTNIVVVTQFDHPRLRSLAIDTGVKGFVCKDNLAQLQTYLRALAAP